MKNPFKNEKTTSYIDWEALKDLNWHCSKCELKSGQAKTWQIWRQSGIQLDTDDKGNFYKTLRCTRCEANTVHRKLKSLVVLEDTTIRSGISPTLAKKIKDLYRNEEAILIREMPPRELEIDHRFPQVRWKSNEEVNDNNMSDEVIKSRFILLTRNHNLLKSRNCEKCVKTNIRGNFPGINFWYEGTKEWVKDKHDETGCIGCFWYDPSTWRKRLNEIISEC